MAARGEAWLGPAKAKRGAAVKGIATKGDGTVLQISAKVKQRIARATISTEKQRRCEALQ